MNLKSQISMIHYCFDRAIRFLIFLFAQLPLKRFQFKSEDDDVAIRVRTVTFPTDMLYSQI